MEDSALLEIRDLHVEVSGKKVLNGVNLKIGFGETHILFGPNGSGKTTLISSIMGLSSYRVIKGEIIFLGKDITNLPIYERANLGIGISFQRPPQIRGVKLKELIDLFARDKEKSVEDYASLLDISELLKREVNVGFSGGEIKRAELLQLIFQNPTIVLLDEPESGVDLENIALVGEAVNKILGRKMSPSKERSLKELRKNRKSSLIISHTGYILDYVDADIGHVMIDGEIICHGNPREILFTIKEHGYDECYRCFRKEE